MAWVSAKSWLHRDKPGGGLAGMGSVPRRTSNDISWPLTFGEAFSNPFHQPRDVVRRGLAVDRQPELAHRPAGDRADREALEPRGAQRRLELLRPKNLREIPRRRAAGKRHHVYLPAHQRRQGVLLALRLQLRAVRDDL